MLRFAFPRFPSRKQLPSLAFILSKTTMAMDAANDTFYFCKAASATLPNKPVFVGVSVPQGGGGLVPPVGRVTFGGCF